ncbi:unnamed protein product [Soboliphyme baturini]|uniref:TPR_REGION domain-containing protein n=1 Tax=Soboliphyme baturini TaxID=241478 RepID=A0A183J813_9BILA|nr:unnamed protein product [Soboliphyme baturini]
MRNPRGSSFHSVTMDLNIGESFFEEQIAEEAFASDFFVADYVPKQVKPLWFLDNALSENALIWQHRGNFLYACRKYKQAARAYENALTLLPEELTFQTHELNESLVCCFLQMAEFEQAEQFLLSNIDKATFDVKLRCVFKSYELYKKIPKPERCFSVLFVLLTGYDDNAKFWIELHRVILLFKNEESLEVSSLPFCESCLEAIAEFAFSYACKLYRVLQQTSCGAMRERVVEAQVSLNDRNAEKRAFTHLHACIDHQSFLQLDCSPSEPSATEFSYREDEFERCADTQANDVIFDESEALRHICSKWFNGILCSKCIKCDYLSRK